MGQKSIIWRFCRSPWRMGWTNWLELVKKWSEILKSCHLDQRTSSISKLQELYHKQYYKLLQYYWKVDWGSQQCDEQFYCPFKDQLWDPEEPKYSRPVNIDVGYLRHDEKILRLPEPISFRKGWYFDLLSGLQRVQEESLSQALWHRERTGIHFSQDHQG